MMAFLVLIFSPSLCKPSRGILSAWMEGEIWFSRANLAPQSVRGLPTYPASSSVFYFTPFALVSQATACGHKTPPPDSAHDPPSPSARLRLQTR
ncbi:hypothetical protein EV126DRAFT_15641 [Verticillium dahliae]|nr:hypothetical protein EV126DRAFT_15641 [Verticillium dahliae]